MKPKKNTFPKGILLDVGCKDRKEPNWIGIDWQKRQGVDIVHDLAKFPYPIKSESCLTIKCAHVVEHIPPTKMLSFMDELWRMLRPAGQLAISAPYAGSPGYFQDPTHCTPITERTWQHFDPKFPLYEQYRPKPWQIEHNAYKPDSNVEAILRKVVPVDLSDSLELATKAMNLGALQKINELVWFLESIKGKSLKTVVEIGTANGGVFWALCQVAYPDALLIGLDNASILTDSNYSPQGKFKQSDLDQKKYMAEAVKKIKKFARTAQRTYLLQTDSHLFETKKNLLQLLDGREIDLLFIDGDHSYEGVSQDWKMYSPLVKKGGLVAFHDICFHPAVPHCQVDKFWKKLKKGRQVTEFIDQNETNWGGIGVVAI
jgi:predicted O-methyltransferase YrrM